MASEITLPPLDARWTHWILYGDNVSLGAFEGTDVAGAIRIIRENEDRFAKIWACRAQVTPQGAVLVQDTRRQQVVWPGRGVRI